MSARIAALAAAIFLAGCVASSTDKSTALNDGMPTSTSAASFADTGTPAPARASRTATLPSASGSSTAAPSTAGTSAGVEIPVSGEAAHVPASAVSAVTAAGTPGSDGYRVGPLDVLDITVFKVEDLTKTVQVSESGKFGYPLIGEVQASGKTVSEIEKDLATKLGGSYLRNPQVTVLVKEYNSHRITVEGSVKKPGVFPMQGPMTLLQSLAMAGGLEEVADGSLIVFRKVDGKSAAARFNMADLRSQKADDPDLQPGDIVMVPSSDLKIGLSYIMRAVPLLNAFMLL